MRNVFTSEPCEHCGQSSERSHPGGVIARRWLCRACGNWQALADPRPAKVFTEEEGYGSQRPFDPSSIDILEAPTLIDMEAADSPRPVAAQGRRK